MPTDTFLNLSKEKKEKILLAAKKEFSRVPFEETSIKNIVEEAQIARGSFYQYFESKEDLLLFLMKDKTERVDQAIQKALKEKKGEIFEIFITIYDYMINEIFNQSDFDFHRRIFENLKTGEDMFLIKPPPFFAPFYKEKIYEQMDVSKLKAENEQEVRTIINMLYSITRKALVSNFKYASKEDARIEYIRQINYLKYGTYQE